MSSMIVSGYQLCCWCPALERSTAAAQTQRLTHLPVLPLTCWWLPVRSPQHERPALQPGLLTTCITHCSLRNKSETESAGPRSRCQAVCGQRCRCRRRSSDSRPDSCFEHDPAGTQPCANGEIDYIIRRLASPRVWQVIRAWGRICHAARLPPLPDP